MLYHKLIKPRYIVLPKKRNVELVKILLEQDGININVKNDI